MKQSIGSFELDVTPNGIGHVVFSRPPVNAVSLSVYEDIGRLVAVVEASTDIRVLVLSAPESARAWCGGADLNDFVGMDEARRKERYAFINERVPGFAALDRPVIAAINGHAVGIGVMLAGLCDLRVGAEDARFSCPEIDYGLITGSAGIFGMLKVPEAKVREMLYTGGRYTARELESTGLFNDVLPRAEVLPRAMELAAQIATKSLPVLRARKLASIAAEGRTWMEAYLDAQALSGRLVGGEDSAEGVRAFLEHRKPRVRDR
jgi:enoyl-CoA hydratase